MDDIVLKAMARWPNVPSVYGWLKLDRRGRWLIKGDPITNPTVNAFIGRNYMRNDLGQWYFQNGPQRVLVELEYTPYVYRLWRQADGSLTGATHTDLPINQPSRCWLDDEGNLLIDCEHGIGCVETQSLATVLSAFSDSEGNPLPDDTIEALLTGDDRTIRSSHVRWGAKLLPLGFVQSKEVSDRFGFDRFPQPPAGQPPC
jgi:hypothetical protein